ncbi:hypothetical protein M011DRAFT_412111 [Sporormia fimetaria CBS 119925]|uniref:Uncharacterized protein n=1 Tax=Sporormia fimetaria CBS 119925 TaxID=1340428 RepID=A0A6A6UWN2_9PLEO|nr:hypothetical protein M011DRAFT_412111 [Sporormia fimetaria CBS 119925]
MNYANMIEEKNLKKTFIIATLCSTLIGTFTSSMGLWDRVNEKRKQRHRDDRQNDEIRQLREQVERNEKRYKEDEERRRNRPEDLGQNFQMSGAMIQRTYDEGFGRLGRRFAMGDTMTENQLQAQVIALQQTVISVLQDALYNDRQLTRADMAKLVAASNSAREGSIDALRNQQQRLLIDAPPARPLSIASAPSSRRSSPPRQPAPLFCTYAEDLQYSIAKPLAADFAPGGRCFCPHCGIRIPASADDYWAISKRTPITIAENGYEKQVLETRQFFIDQRFVVKCHTGDGQFACVLCNKNRDVDAICRSVESLVKHVGNFHDTSELEMDVDLSEGREARVGSRLALPPAPAIQAPGVVTKKEVRETVYR